MDRLLETEMASRVISIRLSIRVLREESATASMGRRRAPTVALVSNRSVVRQSIHRACCLSQVRTGDQ